MDTNDDGMISPHEEIMGIKLQTSNNLDLNVDQGCGSPTVVNVSAVQSSLSSKDEATMNGVLKVGMEFESDEHAYNFYNKYAGLVGFNVRKDWVNRSKIHGQVASRKFTCSKEGYRRKDRRDINVKKHRKETRTGCLAHMIITRQPDGKYRVTHFEANHNHENVNPIDVQKLQELSPKKVDAADVIEVDSANSLETQSKLAFRLFGRPFGSVENLDYLSINYDNYLRSGRTKDIKQGEAACLLYYFQRQHFQNPSFFYAVQLDIDDKVSNIFWADDNMIVDYDHFGDVVCLETTFRANEYFWPLVLFVGLNHHKQVVIFGAALLYDETVESLKWLFRTFIESMSGREPKVIHTDQDATIVEAINSILPKTNHRICVWQMYENALKHLSNVTKTADSFAENFKSCVFYQGIEEDFIHAWDAMINKFGLQQNEWLRWMFREKEKWTMVHGRNTFFVDLKTGHLGENLSNNLRNFLNSDIDVLQFFKHFENMVNEHRYKEIEASYDMGRCTPRLMANVVLLKRASEVYTPEAFEVFQREYEKCLNIVVNQCSENGSLFEYKANIYGEHREYTVTFNSLDNTVICSCLNFECVGFLCCHALKVLDHRNIKVVPVHYILKRWTKEARVKGMSCSNGCPVEENPQLATSRRYKDLCHSMLKISSRAAGSHQAFEFAVRQLDEIIQGLEKILRLKPSGEAQVITSSSTGADIAESDQTETFVDGNVIEFRDDHNIRRGTIEKERFVTNEAQMNNFSNKISRNQRAHCLQPSQVDAVTSISCSSPAGISSPSPTLSPVTQGLYNFETNQVVQCLYQPPNMVMDQQSHPELYQSQNFYSTQHDSPNQAQSLRESLIHSSFQDSMSNNAELRQAVDVDVQQPHSSSFIHRNHRYGASDTTYFGSK